MRTVLLSPLLFLLFACTSRVHTPTRLPDLFPQVTGESLDKETISLPEAYLGQSVVYLIGYTQRAQFDIDRWILGLLQLDSPAKIVELPAIQGMSPSLVSEFINDGMRSGIPAEDWSSVITLYSEDADLIVDTFGNERPQSTHVVLVDSEGNIEWFYNRGYSATAAMELDAEIRSLLNAST